jgi:tetratricopeptide (TPR) repeat protein
VSTKKPRKKRRKSSQPKPGAVDPGKVRLTMEKGMWDISRALADHEFASEEEANAFLQEMLASGGPPLPVNLTPLEQAQAVMYEAWDSSGKQRIELALGALMLSKDCADAYVLLAEEIADSPIEAKEIYELGVKAGERALGPKAFKEDVGHFWGILETRPYMRARMGLAQCLWVLGERRQAIEHYSDMLRLNPNDNQGVRWLLVNCLLEEGLDESAGRLLAQYEEDSSAMWLYSRALWTFRQEGASENANKRLSEAMSQNDFVPAYLTGKKRLPRNLPEYFSPRHETEAIAYAIEGVKLWADTEGALEWLASNVPERPGGPAGEWVKG